MVSELSRLRYNQSEKCKAARHAYYLRNRERILAESKVRMDKIRESPEEYAEYRRIQCYKAHVKYHTDAEYRAKQKEYSHAYYIKHRDEIRAKAKEKQRRKNNGTM